MLSQSFGAEVSPNTADVLTAVEFDSTGDHLATGDRGGRIVLFSKIEQGGTKQKGKPLDEKGQLQWKPYFQFQSHEPSFDCLKSLPIEESINSIAFCDSVKESILLLSTNDKTIKLWKVNHRMPFSPKAVDSLKRESKKKPGQALSAACLRVPTARGGSPIPTASPKQVFQDAHAYVVNSVSTNSDGRTFLSADDLRINWWDMEVTQTCYNVVDIKPRLVEELAEVVTSACFHPTRCHLLAFSSSKGVVRLVDSRAAATGEHCAQQLPSFGQDAFTACSPFSEVVTAVSDVSFSPDGRYVLARDYLSVKISDTCMTNRPVQTIPVNVYLRPALAELYESESIYDRFRVRCNHNGTLLLSGSYSNRISVHNFNGSKHRDLTLPGAVPFFKPAITEKLHLHLQQPRPTARSSSAHHELDPPTTAEGEGEEEGEHETCREVCRQMAGLGEGNGGREGACADWDADDNTTVSTADSTVSSQTAESTSPYSSPPRGQGGVAKRLRQAASWAVTAGEPAAGDEMAQHPEGDPTPPPRSERSTAEPPRGSDPTKRGRSDFPETEYSSCGPGPSIDMGSYVIRHDQKVLHYAWHPQANLVAIAGRVGLYIYNV